MRKLRGSGVVGVSSSVAKNYVFRWRLCCYTLVNSIWWEYIIFLIVVFNAVSLILDLISRPTFELVAEIILIIFSSAAFSFLITVIVIHVSLLNSESIRCFANFSHYLKNFQ